MLLINNVQYDLGFKPKAHPLSLEFRESRWSLNGNYRVKQRLVTSKKIIEISITAVEGEALTNLRSVANGGPVAISCSGEGFDFSGNYEIIWEEESPDFSNGLILEVNLTLTPF